MTGQLEVGTRIGSYVVSGVVGHGGMATVYAAEPVSGGPPVALKVMASELSDDDAFRRRFLREPGYVGEVAHPNLMPIHDFGESAGALYLAMPLVRGRDLHTLIALESPLTIDRALAILAQVAAALDALHAKGVLHRDVKPGNVIVASGEGDHPAEHAYLTDFGLSKSPDRDSAPLTGTGQFVGTADYSAPEQIAGDEVDGRADAYSLACMLVEVLTGQPPFPREGVVETLQAQMAEPPPALDERRSDLPEGVNAVVARALAKQPRDRFETCMAFVDAAAAAAGLEPAEKAGGGAGRAAQGQHHDPAARRVALRLELDLEAGVARISLGETGQSVQVTRRDATWRFEPDA